MKFSKIITFAGLIIIVGWVIFSWQVKKIEGRGVMACEQVIELHPYITEQAEVCDGSTYGILMEEAGVGGSVAAAIFDSAELVYDLSRIRLGRNLDLVFTRDTHELKRVTYQIDSEEVYQHANVNLYS